MRNWASSYTNGQEANDKAKGQIKPCPTGYCPPKLKPPSGVQDGLKFGPVPRNTTYGAQTFPIVKTLARYVLGGEGGSTASQAIQAFVYNPSNRLRLKIVVCFEPDNQSATDPSFSNTPTWKVQAMSRNPETGREVLLQQAYPDTGTKNLPDAYEVDTAAQLLRVDVTLDDDNFAATYVPTTARASCVLICTWEPNDSSIDPVELSRLYSQCSVAVRSLPVVITNNAV